MYCIQYDEICKKHNFELEHDAHGDGVSLKYPAGLAPKYTLRLSQNHLPEIPSIPCPSCGFTLKPVWFLEKELDNHGIPTGRTHKACSCLLCDSCGHKETVDSSFNEPYK